MLYPTGRPVDPLPIEVPAPDPYEPWFDANNVDRKGWNRTGRHHVLETTGCTGVIPRREAGGEGLAYRYSNLPLRPPAINPSTPSTRMVTRIASEPQAIDPNERPALSNPQAHVFLLGGWSESDRVFSAPVIEILLTELERAGYDRSQILGLNPVGIGTPEYSQPPHSKSLSSLSVSDYFWDVLMTVQDLIEHLPIDGGDVYFVSHSMGEQLMLAGLPPFLLAQGQMRASVRAVMPLAGLTSSTRSEFLNFQTLKRLGVTRLIESFIQMMTGQGSINLTEAEHARIMFGRSQPGWETKDAFSRTSLGPGRAFQQLAWMPPKKLEELTARYG
ncbi:MAG: hypothetical protein Q8P27_01390, partial [Candidatus Peregrinibacteria bacterium]|nr:hypothetical protein [Candidatus Peregrinibacteria bacterium]